ncbi:nucleotidyl transferase AbiEii/AbiGii toxin family protein [Roseateles sp. GG27B]
MNLFVQDMPRLSVDIDVVFIDHRPNREQALSHIANELTAIKLKLERQRLQVYLPPNALGDEVRMQVSDESTQVKVEVNFVFRGTVLPIQMHTLVPLAETLFTTAVSVPTLAIEELYGSKLVAAMDRHTRAMYST